MEFQNSEDEAEYYKDLIQQSSEDDQMISDTEKDRKLETKRKKLLEGLSQGVKKEIADADNIGDVDWDQIDSDDLNSEDLDALEKKTKEKPKSGLDVKFAKGFGENIGKKFIEEKKEKRERSKMSEFDKY